jgi:hypothetical protein
MNEKLLLAILLGAAGFREMFRQYKALVRIKTAGERHRFDRWGHYSAFAFGLGTGLIAAGQLWPVLASPGWFVAGLAAVTAMPIPCGIPIVNDFKSLKILRNVFFLVMGIAFIAHSLGSF